MSLHTRPLNAIKHNIQSCNSEHYVVSRTGSFFWQKFEKAVCATTCGLLASLFSTCIINISSWNSHINKGFQSLHRRVLWISLFWTFQHFVEGLQVFSIWKWRLYFRILSSRRRQCGCDGRLLPGCAVVQCGLGQDIWMWEPALGGRAGPAEVQAQPLLHRAGHSAVCPGGQHGWRACSWCGKAGPWVRGGLGGGELHGYGCGEGSHCRSGVKYLRGMWPGWKWGGVRWNSEVYDERGSVGCDLLFSISTVSEYSPLSFDSRHLQTDISVIFGCVFQIWPGCHRAQRCPLPVWGPSVAFWRGDRWVDRARGRLFRQEVLLRLHNGQQPDVPGWWEEE